MTDRLQGVLVHFTREVREDDAEHITAAIRMIQGVARVTPVVADAASYMAETRVRAGLANRVYEFAESLRDVPLGTE